MAGEINSVLPTAAALGPTAAFGLLLTGAVAIVVRSQRAGDCGGPASGQCRVPSPCQRLR